MTMPKTPEEVKRLKESWRRDPCFDLEDYPGFEDYHDGLLAYRKQTEAEWEIQKQKEHNRLASMVCPRTFTGHAYKGDFGQDLFEFQYQNCLVERCAWWMAHNKCCVIMMTGATGTI